VSGAGVQSLRFEAAGGGTLAADIRAPSLAQIDNLSQLLVDAGIAAKVMAASEEGGIATARLEMKGQ
jgi:hypothetical protein